MGYYVNPREQSKESFLRQKGIAVPNSFKWSDLPKGKLPVVLIDNGPFTAAGIAYHEREFLEFTSPDDSRPHVIYLVSIEDLLTVAGQGFAEYVKRNNILTA